MRYKEVIWLISTEIITDEIGNQKEVETERKVFANQFEVSSYEFYDAATKGLKPEKRFEIYEFEYKGETKLKHNGTEYNIIRAQTKGEKIRLTCEKVIGNG